MAENITPDKILNCRGMNCPMPVLETKKAIDKLTSGQILEIMSTDPAAENDLPAFARRTGHEYLGSKEEEEGFTRYYLKVK